MLILEIFSARLTCVFISALLSRILTKKRREENYYLCDFMGFSSGFCVEAERKSISVEGRNCYGVDLEVNSFDGKISVKGFKLFKAKTPSPCLFKLIKLRCEEWKRETKSL